MEQLVPRPDATADEFIQRLLSHTQVQTLSSLADSVEVWELWVRVGYRARRPQRRWVFGAAKGLGDVLIQHAPLTKKDPWHREMKRLAQGRPPTNKVRQESGTVSLR